MPGSIVLLRSVVTLLLCVAAWAVALAQDPGEYVVNVLPPGGPPPQDRKSVV